MDVLDARTNTLALQYEKRKKQKKRAATISAICSIGLTILIVLAFCMLTVDRFTITTSPNYLSLCEVEDMSEKNLTTRLSAPPLLEATDTQYSDIPKDIEQGLGNKNSDTDYSYFAYSFYLLNTSNEPESLNYSMTVKLSEFSNNLEEAIKVMIIKDGVERIYAKANEDGSSKLIYDGEHGAQEPQKIIGTTIPFKENKHIIIEPYNLSQGDYSKFTIVMWIDGWESNNTMLKGSIKLDLDFSVISKNEK